MRKVLSAVWQFVSYVFWPQRRPKELNNKSILACISIFEIVT